MASPTDRKRRLRKTLYVGATALFSVLGVYLIWSLRSLILPTTIGALLAYICAPLLEFGKRHHIRRGMGILILFAFMALTVIALVRQVKAAMPDEKSKLELRVRAQYKINERYRGLMGLDAGSPDGNVLYDLVGQELDPGLDRLNGLLMLNFEERELFERYMSGYAGQPPVAERVVEYYRANLEHAGELAAEAAAATSGSGPAADTRGSLGAANLASVLNVVALWVVMPFVFLFLLIDDGRIHKSLIDLVPNEYFEVALTVFDNVDRALGDYLRGTALQCSLVGLTLIVCLTLIGVESQWAVLIGIVAGLANAIPFLGPAIGLIVGVGYALIVEDVHSILPFMNADNLVFGVVVAVVIAQLLDNAIFQPFVMGGAVDLHPLVVILGVMGGSILFGFAGMLFAVPAIVVFKVVVATVFGELRAYRLI